VPPSGTFTQIVAAPYFTCGIRPDKSLTCWGDTTLGQATPPGGTFDAVAIGDLNGCALRTDGSVVCWAEGSQPPGGGFTSVSAGDYGMDACGLRRTGRSAPRRTMHVP
jgi:hypothetical protein